MSTIIREDFTGITFNRLTVTSYAYTKNRQRYWNCICKCGNNHVTNTTGLKHGYVTSCGCARTEALRKGIHKSCNTKEYKTWIGIKSRCYNPNIKHFLRYGGRGITVCDRWRDSFQNFIDDIGKAPSNSHTIDRIDVNGNYEPGNCRWATRYVQSNNRSNTRKITIDGITKPIKEWSDELQMRRGTIYSRLYICKWNGEDALKKEVLKRGYEPSIKDRPNEETIICKVCERLLPISAYGKSKRDYINTDGLIVKYEYIRKLCRKCVQIKKKSKIKGTKLF